ncbi:MAG: hypothetical protein K2X80_08525 [Pseudomonadaceae bacterium]|nr:hypothetical protein [Pseudomonadaceae bacterium]
MANFNIDSSLSNGKRLDWLAAPNKGETVEQVVIQVRQAAMKKFGNGVWFNRWTHVVACNGFVTVQMHA